MMKRKILLLVVVVLIAILSTSVLFACGEEDSNDTNVNTDGNTNGNGNDNTNDNTGDSSQVGNENENIWAQIISIQGGKIDGLNAYLEVAPTITDVDLSGMLTVSLNSSWQLYADKMGQVNIPTKIASIPFDGENIYYIVVNSPDGTVNRTYTLTIFKNFYTNVYLVANNQVVKTLENVASHTNVELNAPSEIDGYYLTWDMTTYYVNEANKRIEASAVTPKTYTVTMYTDGGVLSVENTKAVAYNSEYSLPVPTKKGYTFKGWSYNDELVTNASGVATSKYNHFENLTYTAVWEINYYTLSVTSDDTSMGTVNEVSGEKAYGSRVTLVATRNYPYSFDGWYLDGERVSEDISYTITIDDSDATYVAKFTIYRLTTESDLAGVCFYYPQYTDERIQSGSEITFHMSTNPGYTWLGWYNGDTLLSLDRDYTFTMPKESLTLTAKHIACPVTLERNMVEAGSVYGIEGATALDEETTITAVSNVGYVFTGWYEGTTKVSDTLTYTFTMGTEVKTYTAKWEVCSSHNVVNCACTKCGYKEHSGEIVNGVCIGCNEQAYVRNDSTVIFGTYPQSLVSTNALNNTLTNMAGDLPTATDSADWISYGYYIEGAESNFMWYIDKEYEGEKYRGVYFTQYRPVSTIDVPDEERYANQYRNGYSVNEIYWFKYEPIKWRILEEKDGKALILADLVLDSQNFATSMDNRTEGLTTIYACNWEYSVIRSWLNETFYDLAFNSLEKAIIQETELDNKTTASGGTNNNSAYVQNNTTDKIFLLSHNDVTNGDYGFSWSYETLDTLRKAKASDYANAQGVYSKADSSNQYYASWMTRSPNDKKYLSVVYEDGRIVTSFESVVSTAKGIRPAITIKL